MAKLTFVLEDGQEVVAPLTEHTTIGRDEDNDVVVEDQRVSKHHAELMQNADGSFQVFDLKSTAGTFVNDQRVVRHTVLHGDRLAFGPLTATLHFHDAAPPAVPAEAPPASSAGETHTRLEAEIARLQARLTAAEKEWRDWEKLADKERAMHTARLDALRAEEEEIAPRLAAAQQAEAAHQGWLDAIQALSRQHAEQTAGLERLTAAAASAQKEAAAQDELARQARDRLQQIRDECGQDETLLNTLRQQIIEMETRLQDSQALVTTHEEQARSSDQRQAEAALRLQELASAEKQLAQKLAAETRRLTEVQEQRAALEAQCQELATAEQQLADARMRLAAVEQRQRAVQSDIAQGITHLDAAPQPSAGEAPQKSDPDLSAPITAARAELAELKSRIAALRVQQGESAPAAEGATRIVQVSTFRLNPVAMKSEGTRLQNAGELSPSKARAQLK